jgi:hypothetical protein
MKKNCISIKPMSKIIARDLTCQSRPRYQPIDVPGTPIDNSDFSIIPTINRYFYIAQRNIDVTNGATIPANLFSDDNGNPISEFMIFSPNGYVNLHINGVIQEGGLFEVNSTTLTINPTPGRISAGTAIIIESLGFSAEKNL